MNKVCEADTNHGILKMAIILQEHFPFDLEGTQVFYWLFKQSTNNCTAENVKLRCTTQSEFTCAQK